MIKLCILFNLQLLSLCLSASESSTSAKPRRSLMRREAKAKKAMKPKLDTSELQPIHAHRQAEDTGQESSTSQSSASSLVETESQAGEEDRQKSAAGSSSQSRSFRTVNVATAEAEAATEESVSEEE